MTIDQILLILAFLCFVLAALGLVSKVNLVPLGLALLVLTAIVP